MHMAKKALSVFCAVTLSVGMVPSAAFAVDDTAPQRDIAAAPMSTGDGAFTSFSINGVNGVIDEENCTVKVTLPAGTDVTALVPVWTVTPDWPWPPEATEDGGTTWSVQASGVSSLDFTHPVVYKISDSAVVDVEWTVTVELASTGGGTGTGGDEGGSTSPTTSTTVTIGTAQKSDRAVPFESYYNNSVTEFAYTATEVGTKGTITSLSFNVAAATSGLATEAVRIYLGHIPASSVVTEYVAASDWTLVYSGNPTLGTAKGWEKFDFNEGSKSFTYNGKDDLAVVVVREGSHYLGALNYYSTQTDSKSSFTERSDSVKPLNMGPADAFTAMDATSKNSYWFHPDIRFDMTVCSHPNKTFVEHVAATCLDGGYDKYTCPDCNTEVDLATESEPALGHNFEVAQVHAPDCTHSGWTDYKCSRCDATKTGDETAALDHAWTATTLDPATCTEPAHQNYACSRCEETKTEDVGSPNGHHFVDHECTVCGASEPGFGGVPVTIGEGTLSQPYTPFFGDCYNSLSEQIYTASELGGAHLIKSIGFNCSVLNKIQTSSVKIYLGHLPTTTLSKYTVPSDMTLVYSGSPVIGAATGWQTFDFNEGNFAYNGTDSLAVIVVESTSSTGYRIKYECSATDGYSSCTYGSDYVAYDPNKTNPSATDYRESQKFRPNIQLSYVEQVDVPTAAEGLMYNGAEQVGVAAAKGYTLESASAIDAGDYVATAHLADGYAWSDGTTADKTVNWSIAKAKLIATYLGEAVYMGQEPSLTVTVSGFVGEENGESAEGYVAPTVTAPNPQEVGSFMLTPAGGEAKNYEFEYVGGYLTLSYIAELSLPTANEDLVYSGSEQVGVESEEGYTLEGATATDAGDYVATAHLASGYAWGDGTTADKTVEWSIAKAKLVAAYEGETIVLGEEPALNVTVTGFVGEESAETAEGYVAPTVTAPSLREAGVFPLTPEGGAAKNYEFEYVDGDLIVDPADVTELFEAINATAALLEGVATSEDGTDVEVGTKWATAEAIGSLMSAIDKAQTIANASGVTQAQVDEAKSALLEAASNFKTAEGTMQPRPIDCGFNDVKAEIEQFGVDNVWYVNEGWLGLAVDAGLMGGYTDGSGNFGPYDSITRGQVAVIVHRAATGIAPGEADNNVDAGFVDVESGAYYAAAVKWCAEQGIVTGYTDGSGEFRPNQPVSRQELATMLARFAGWAKTGKAEVPEADSSSYQGLTGADMVEPYAQAAMAWCVENEVIGGIGGTDLAPTNGAWRASAAKMIIVTLSTLA